MVTAGDARLVTLDDIRAAAKRLTGEVLRSPLLALGERAYVKAESLQPTGSFKLRGALNAMAQLSEDQRRAGVVTHSSGNHAQAVAYVARRLGIRAVVVMPDNAPAVKVRRVEGWGARIVFVAPSHEARTEAAAELARNEGLTLIPSANDERVIAGQGTAGLEIVEQLAERLGRVQDEVTVVVPIGQGGLAAGVATAVRSLVPGARVLGVEPELGADARESLHAGRIVRWTAEAVQRTIADGLRIEAVAPLAFPHLQRYLDDVVTVTEAEIEQAVVRAADDARLVVEPSGAVSLAAALREARAGAATVVAVVSGGNIDGRRYADILDRYHRP